MSEKLWNTLWLTGIFFMLSLKVVVCGLGDISTDHPSRGVFRILFKAGGGGDGWLKKIRKEGNTYIHISFPIQFVGPIIPSLLFQ